MIVYVANPIYDSVFKYIMEDDRIAKTILSALLKKEVLSVEVRPHEYANETQDKISMFRIDFGARVREADGTVRLILIELQKTWIETETLRFRQYLGAQYSNKHNIDKEHSKGFALPMVAIYLMGHRVGNIDEPVLYVDHKAYNYNGEEVTHGMPDPFVESLIHNSIIVQIPLLHGKINKHLDRVLSVFDQTRADKDNPQLLRIDDALYAGDDDMEYIVHRLTAAASSPKIRQDMNVEDEYYSAIEDRDTAIMSRDKHIAQQAKQIQEQDSKIQEQDSKIQKQDSKIQEQDSKLQEQNSKIQEQDSKIQEQDSLLQEKDNMLKGMVKAMVAQGSTVSSIASMLGKSPDDIKRMLQ